MRVAAARQSRQEYEDLVTAMTHGKLCTDSGVDINVIR